MRQGCTTEKEFAERYPGLYPFFKGIAELPRQEFLQVEKLYRMEMSEDELAIQRWRPLAYSRKVKLARLMVQHNLSFAALCEMSEDEIGALDH